MWSSMIISVPGVSAASMPPAALVRTSADPDARHDARRERDGAQVVPLVKMHAPRQGRYPPAGQRSDDEPPFMADDPRCRPVREVGIRERRGVLEARGEIAETRAEHDRDVGLAGPGPDEFDGFLDLFVIIHCGGSQSHLFERLEQEIRRSGA